MRSIEMREETILKIASLLMEPVGSRRDVHISLASFPLDADMTAEDVQASIRLTRLNASVLANGKVTGTAELVCARCLEPYQQPFESSFSEEFRQTLDVQSGRGLPQELQDDDEESGDDDLAFEINDAHEIDMTELLRQWILLALPMRPLCGPDCPGIQDATTQDDEDIDDRFAALQDLLDDPEA